MNSDADADDVVFYQKWKENIISFKKVSDTLFWVEILKTYE